MSLEARISPVWSKQKLFVAIFFLATGCWFLYDGIVRWPASNRRLEMYQRYAAANNTEGWRSFAHQQGWVEEAPHRMYETGDIVGQYVFAGLTFAVGGLLFAYWATQKNRVLRVDEEAVYTPAGNRVPFESIVGIGKKRWEAKGLASVRYQDAGRQLEFIVDDYKFEAEPTHQILAVIEERLVARQTTEA